MHQDIRVERDKEKERQIERQRERQTERVSERERERDSLREREGQRVSERKRERCSESHSLRRYYTLENIVMKVNLGEFRNIIFGNCKL